MPGAIESDRLAVEEHGAVTPVRMKQRENRRHPGRAAGELARARAGEKPSEHENAPISHGLLRLTFADGLSVERDVLDRMHGPVCAQARTPQGFAQVGVDPESGTVVWPDGADLASDSLCLRARAWPDQDVAA